MSSSGPYLLVIVGQEQSSLKCVLNVCQSHIMALHVRGPELVDWTVVLFSITGYCMRKKVELGLWHKHKRVSLLLTAKMSRNNVVKPEKAVVSESENTKGPPRVMMTSAVSQETQGHFISLRTVPVVLKNKGKSIKINALLDDASTRSYLNENVAGYLELDGKPVSLSVRVINDAKNVLQSMEVQCQLESCDGHVSQEVILHTTRHVMGNMQVVNWAQQGKQWPHLADIKFPATGKRPIVDMLIGIDLSDLHCALKEIRGAPGEPVAAASHWPGGPSLGHACRSAQVRPRAPQVHIRECLGQF